MGSTLHAVVIQLAGRERVPSTAWESDCPQTWSGHDGEGENTHPTRKLKVIQMKTTVK
jgi:hypothetical protein